MTEDAEEDRQRWAEFERRDGFCNGFVVGLLTGAVVTVLCCLVLAPTVAH
jgi:hypothetical protein